MRKADQFSKDCQADVYVLIFRDGKFFTYSSLEDEQWPPQLSKVVCTQNFAVRCQISDRIQYRTLPKKYSPNDFSTKSACSTDTLHGRNEC